jgi:Protein of unknown function (DUF3768)
MNDSRLNSLDKTATPTISMLSSGRDEGIVERNLLAEALLAKPMTLEQRAATASLNDEARANIGHKCRLVPTDAFSAAYHDQLASILERIKSYDAFDSGVTVFDQRDFGVVFRLNDGSWTNTTPDGDWSQQAIFWQFEYCDPSFSKPSFAPWDASLTARALIIMLPHDFL